MKIICDLVDNEVYIDVVVTEQDCIRVMTGDMITAKQKKLFGRDCFVGIRYGDDEDAS